MNQMKKTMIHKLNLLTDDGEVFEEIPEVQFQIDRRYQVAVVGFDFEGHGGFEEFYEQQPGWLSEHIGKLSEVKFSSQNCLINSLYAAGWDFERYPDPDLVLIKKIKR